MPTAEQDAASKLYSQLMSEIRLRIAAVDVCTSGGTALAPPFVREFCYLQFRMMCELLALGCLAAHGDLKGSKKNELDKLWAADKIIEALGRLNPGFYPVAINRLKTETGFHIEPRPVQPLPKNNLVRLYIKCGDILHRGSTKKILSKNIPIEVRYADLTSIAQKFRDMITEHHIAMLGNRQHFLCSTVEQGGQATVYVAIAESPEPA